jgi:hypothetical protein
MKLGSTSQATYTHETENPHTISQEPLHSEKLAFGLEFQGVLLTQYFLLKPLIPIIFCVLFLFISQLNKDEINSAFFQHDSATAHAGRCSMKLLEGVFVEWLILRGIGLPRSPDFLWGAAKSQVYETSP